MEVVLKKIFSTIRGYLNRFKIIFTLKNYEIVYIFMWVTPFFGNFYERTYRNFSKKIIYDIEDNILLNKISSVNPLSHLLKSNKKTTYLLRRSNYVISSAPGLNNDIKRKTHYLNAISNTFSALHYNVNMKLQLESLFLSCRSS